MSEFIKWCNDNQGFLSLLLTIITAFISILAIIVSIKTARLPFKKKIKIYNSYKYGLMQTPMGNKTSYFITVGVVNVGNRDISTDFIGLGLYKDGRLNRLYPINRNLNCEKIIKPSELYEVDYLAEEILQQQKEIDSKEIIYSIVIDTEGKISKKKFGVFANIINALK